MSKPEWCKGAVLVLAIAALSSVESARAELSITVNSKLPGDIDGGAPEASLQQSAMFAWQEFIALNWPALAGQRDVADDPGQKFGSQAVPPAPLVWQTFRSKVEIFNLTSDHTPPGYSPAGPSYGYNAPVTYIYNTTNGPKPIAPCPGQTAPAAPAWINLDETTQIGQDQMFAGVAPPSEITTNNSAPRLIRFVAKANHIQYQYVAANQYFVSPNPISPIPNPPNPNPLATATMNGIAAFTSNPPTYPPATPYVNFPAGTVEVKSAWRPLNADDNPARFHTATVRFYENKGEGNAACYFEESWGLVGLHIIQKTPSAPAFIYATFEQADNIRTTDGRSVEDPDGTVINTPSGPHATTPEMAYMDSPTAPAVTTKGPFCNPGKQLYFKDNENLSGLTNYRGLKGSGEICVNQRYEPIPQDIVAVNQAAHAAIQAYNTANNVQNSPWPYYKLVSVQAQPFDAANISNSDPTRSSSVFHQANIVVETDYTLQQFKGRGGLNGAPTSYQAKSNTPPPPNVVSPTQSPPTASAVNMGGCMGCHGNAQVSGGSDFSFILAGGETPAPDTPSALKLNETAHRYLQLFTNR